MVDVKRALLSGTAGGIGLMVADAISRRIGLESGHEERGALSNIVHSPKEFINYGPGPGVLHAWPVAGAFLKGFAVGAGISIAIGKA